MEQQHWSNIDSIFPLEPRGFDVYKNNNKNPHWAGYISNTQYIFISVTCLSFDLWIFQKLLFYHFVFDPSVKLWVSLKIDKY